MASPLLSKFTLTKFGRPHQRIWAINIFATSLLYHHQKKFCSVFYALFLAQSAHMTPKWVKTTESTACQRTLEWQREILIEWRPNHPSFTTSYGMNETVSQKGENGRNIEKTIAQVTNCSVGICPLKNMGYSIKSFRLRVICAKIVWHSLGISLALIAQKLEPKLLTARPTKKVLFCLDCPMQSIL